MKTRTVMGLAVLACAALLAHAGQAQPSSYEVVVKDMLTTLGDITKTLGTISDETTADAARPELRKSALKLQELRKQADALKQPEKDEKDLLEQRYRLKFEDALKKLRAESNRVKGLPGGTEAVKEIAVAVKKKR